MGPCPFCNSMQIQHKSNQPFKLDSWNEYQIVHVFVCKSCEGEWIETKEGKRMLFVPEPLEVEAK